MVFCLTCKSRRLLILLRLLFRKKARSANLFACRRAHGDSLSLPPFGGLRVRCRCTFLVGGATSEQSTLCSVQRVDKVDTLQVEISLRELSLDSKGSRTPKGYSFARRSPRQPLIGTTRTYGSRCIIGR